LHTRQGLTLIPFWHNVRGDPVKLSRYNINMAIADNYGLAENADRASKKPNFLIKQDSKKSERAKRF
jgi:hypothetical protein